jgi:hypothetical protein
VEPELRHVQSVRVRLVMRLNMRGRGFGTAPRTSDEKSTQQSRMTSLVNSTPIH